MESGEVGSLPSCSLSFMVPGVFVGGSEYKTFGENRIL